MIEQQPNPPLGSGGRGSPATFYLIEGMMSEVETITACEEMAARFTRSRVLNDETQQELRLDANAAAENLRLILDVGRYRHNKIRCRLCGATIESRNRHDFKSCDCGAVSVDGGTDYLRRLGERENYSELSELWPWLTDPAYLTSINASAPDLPFPQSAPLATTERVEEGAQQ